VGNKDEYFYTLRSYVIMLVQQAQSLKLSQLLEEYYAFGDQGSASNKKSEEENKSFVGLVNPKQSMVVEENVKRIFGLTKKEVLMAHIVPTLKTLSSVNQEIPGLLQSIERAR